MLTAIFADGDYDIVFEDGDQKAMAQHIVDLQEMGFVVQSKRFASWEALYKAIPDA